jgi:AraC-like DNA-binding protein/mannose-6-phosphate isomerase-like protein (cupin superfamily)
VLPEAGAKLKFEPYRGDYRGEERRWRERHFPQHFPLAIKLYSFANVNKLKRFYTHDRLELFVLVAGRGRFQVGDEAFDFQAGDVIFADHRKPHGLLECQGPSRLGITISFMPELICPAGSFPCDSMYLRPFYSRAAAVDPVLTASDECYPAVEAALRNLVSRYFSGRADDPVRQAGCKAQLLEALYHLAEHSGGAASPARAGEPGQPAAFSRLFHRLYRSYAEPITVAWAAALAGMSPFRFMREFKKATGMTFISYLTRLRLAHAYRMLLDTGTSIAAIAARVGFADQSYFDRRFRRQYGCTPRELRARFVSRG